MTTSVKYSKHKALKESLYGNIVICLWAFMLLCVYIYSVQPAFAEEDELPGGQMLTFKVDRDMEKFNEK